LPDIPTGWNAKIYPLLRTGITAAVWYQGESNTGVATPGADVRQYNCSFQAMVTDWREKFSAATYGAISPHFPFGWVQLNSCNRADWEESRTTPAVPINTSGWIYNDPSVHATQGDPLGAWRAVQHCNCSTASPPCPRGTPCQGQGDGFPSVRWAFSQARCSNLLNRNVALKGAMGSHDWVDGSQHVWDRAPCLLGAPALTVFTMNSTKTLKARVLPNTFQAVVLDTPSAYGSVHSPYKQPAGSRLARAFIAAASNERRHAGTDAGGPNHNSARASRARAKGTPIISLNNHSPHPHNSKSVDPQVGAVSVDKVTGKVRCSFWGACFVLLIESAVEPTLLDCLTLVLVKVIYTSGSIYIYIIPTLRSGRPFL
jgi:hypothetical protein